ncbi:hypothetical protein [Cryobacterium gelidum]|uniref:Uncharacterized protein n=1 Tax=Cryobacterium gelidum TaxID=1259164 RepID=A0A4R9AQ75_9MICO|nr:hypothetical protein E3T50_15165 [Cryobacterium gelidum]
MARAHKISFQKYVANLSAEAGGTPDLATQLAIRAEGAQTTAAISGDSAAAQHARRAAEILIDAETNTPNPGQITG